MRRLVGNVKQLEPPWPPEPLHHKVPETTSQGSKLSNATMIPQMTAKADLLHSEDDVSLKLCYAVGDCHALFGPHQDELAYPVHYMVPETTSWMRGYEVSTATMITQKLWQPISHGVRIS